jgi:hypothetical protein
MYSLILIGTSFFEGTGPRQMTQPFNNQWHLLWVSANNGELLRRSVAGPVADMERNRSAISLTQHPGRVPHLSLYF